ncbi:hypothetical protein SCUCBS95973_002230 [Sporothrix curviconia]|uniref:Only prolin and serin are matching in the corresponding protein n=1 Tax=Sporothrix curviconia TaxID=1260050 RepID=A0ABP0B569_9PEZI
MSAKLKPLILPQLVQERKRLDDGQYYTTTTEMVEGGTTGNTSNATNNGLFLVDNASVSDIASPATPTFSHRSGLGHLRYSSSTSSLDLPLSLPSPSYSECAAASPSAVNGLAAAVSAPNAAPSTAAAAVKRVLPDVQEEDLLERVAEHEHEFGDDYSRTHRDSYLYGCLCDEPCEHGRANENIVYERPSYDYDLGFVSDCEATANVPSVQRHRHRAGSSVSSTSNATHDSSFSGLTLRFGSHIHALSRWRSKSTSSHRAYGNLTGAPASEPSLSRAPSSRSSSLSAGRPAPAMEPVPVLSPALSSYYGSTESIAHIPTANSTLDAEHKLDEDQSRLERDRMKASTPLLPPVFTNDSDLQQQQPVSPLPPPSLQTSPLQTPAMASPVASPGLADPVPAISPMTVADAAIPSMSLSLAAIGGGAAATAPASPVEAQSPPPLHRKFSTASFHAPFGAPTPPMTTAVASAIPGALEPHDEWCDRLGHANYTILPKPYSLPMNDTTDTQALHVLRDDWMLARTNYAKHLVRTGEHYGTTSNTYVLTEAKWVETDREWQRAHDVAMAHITKMLVRAGGDGRARAATLDQLPPIQHHNVSCVIPQILDNAEGKFPGLGDEDIVGPMDRVACMEREDGGFVATAGTHGEKNGMSRFLRGLADRVRNRK